MVLKNCYRNDIDGDHLTDFGSKLLAPDFDEFIYKNFK